jgi:hypothetical protein
MLRLRENKKLGLRSACHHAQLGVARWNVLNSAKAGLTSMEHWYGLPEALFTDRTIQNYPVGLQLSKRATSDLKKPENFGSRPHLLIPNIGIK